MVKSLFSKVHIFLLVFLAVYSPFRTTAQNPIVTLNYNGTGLTSGTGFAVPLLISGNVNVSTFTLYINYDSDYITYVSLTQGPSFTGFMNGNTVVINDSTRQLQIGWTPSGPPWYVYCGTNTLACTITFTFNGGQGTLDFMETLCEITDPSLLPYPNVTYNNGSYSGSYGTLHSVTAGGIWSASSTWQETKIPSKAYNVVITGLEVTVTANGKCRGLTINPTGVLKVNSGATVTTLSDCTIQ